MTDKDVMQMALEDLETWNEDHNFEGTEATCAALRTALAQSETYPENFIDALRFETALDRIDAAPVAKNESGRITWLVNDWPQNCLLYTAPPKKEWVGLTNEEMMVAAFQAGFDVHEDYDNEDDPDELHWWTEDGDSSDDTLHKLRDIIEAKLKDKNT